MAKLSRTEKYKELRESLQNNLEESFSTKALSDFESRLNRIDANNFAAPSEYSTDDHDAVHVRKEVPADISNADTEEIRTPEPSLMIFGNAVNHAEEDDDSDYLDHVISEVKKYNIDQGTALSENTQLNILSSIKVEDSPVRPYVTTPAKKEKGSSDTADIPFKGTFAGRTSSIPAIEEQQERTVEDISAEVFNLMNEIDETPVTEERPAVEYTAEHSDSIEVGFPSEQASRHQVLHETRQMRAQLDDYEDDLNEVNDRMRQTNRVLNIVLIALIAALLVVLGVVFWMIIATK